MSDTSSPWEPDPDRDVVLDAKLVQILAHPLRNKMLKVLRVEGPDTSTGLAAKLGVNTGATSYHLRQLADAGLIVEDEEHGNKRDRWWRSAHRSTYVHTGDLTASDPELASSYFHSIASMYAENMFRHADELPSLSSAWQEAGTLSDWSLRLTPSELSAMLDELWQVIARYRVSDEAGEKGADARAVTLQIQAFPEVRQ